MRNDVKLQKWKIEATGKGWSDDFLESVFFTGNGRMGARGYSALTPEASPDKTGLFAAGIFGELKPGITDFVNLPTPLYIQMKADGAAINADDLIVHRTLDLKTGLFTAEYSLDCAGKLIDVCEERFFSLHNTALLVQRVTLKAKDTIPLELLCGIHTACCNLPVPDDQMKENKETVQLTAIGQKDFSNDGFSVQLKTKGTEIKIREEVFCHVQNLEPSGTFEKDEGLGLVFRGTACAETPFILEQCTCLTTSRDRDPRIQKADLAWSFDALLAQNESAWSERWKSADVEIDGDDRTDAALRYVIFQLIANDSSKDSSVNIGARGLTHTRYKGCYFWDTDLFMMPFYLYTDPEAAKNLMQYRLNTLPQAKRNAQKMNSRGARYPWMTSFDGSEQCESWDIGASELHVTADVVYALNHYIKATGDRDFYAHGAAEVYIETARFWQSRYTAESGSRQVNLLFCKGPDEYCGITNNNLYTNMLVKENLKLAQEAAEYFMRNDKAACLRLGITEKETEEWKRLEGAIKLPKDPITGHFKQDDTFDLLEPIDPADLKQGDAASYHRVCFDRLQRYRVIKQADVILLMSRLPEVFTAKEKRAAWEDFEPVCLHDSTLSFASHALFAAQNGMMDAAWNYFQKALFLDLQNVMENTGSEGLHLACLGESWQAAILGFAGLSFQNGKPELRPHLPESWERIRFRFFWQGRQFEADIGKGHVVMKRITENHGTGRNSL